MKKWKRLLLVAAAVLTLSATATMQPAKAAGIPETTKIQFSWFWNLLKDWGIFPQIKPEVPQEKPEATPPAVPEGKPEVKPPAVPEQKPEEKPETDTPSASVHALERRVAELVNQERAKRGLAPLTLSADLCAKARIKSQDMADNRYFSHQSPTYGSPFDMMKRFGITYRTAGENIAMGYATAEAVVQAWMNSEGHRKNILSANYTTLGVGYVANGNYWTQWFIG